MLFRRMLECRTVSASRRQLTGCVEIAASARNSSRWLHACVIALLMCSCGCSFWKKEDDPWKPSISGVRGPLERAIYGEESALELGRRFTEAERREAKLARETFDRGEYKDAIRLCKKNAKNLKDSSLGEEAQFMLAESYFHLGYYAKAQDAYDQLFQDYPSTRYVEPSTRKLFRIARLWLEVAEPEARNEIRQVSGEKILEEAPEKKSMDPTIRARVLPNFHDKSRPIFDTQGNALKALKSIWMNDPTGPLADDALMLTASHYQRDQNFVEADRYYEILREEYPDSPHLEEAFVLGAHVKQMSYQGPYYEGSDLTGARKLKEQTLQLFPASHERTQIRQDLEKLYLQEAERVWSKVAYYQKKNRPRSIAIACAELISDYPDTPYAADARRILSTIDKSELQGLPEIPEFVNSIQRMDPSPEPRNKGPVKSVSFPRIFNRNDDAASEKSDSSAGTQDGRARL
ncbi:MAG: outer membrane protein assembly factor BamD [Planctomycetota bacterium]